MITLSKNGPRWFHQRAQRRELFRGLLALLGCYAILFDWTMLDSMTLTLANQDFEADMPHSSNQHSIIEATTEHQNIEKITEEKIQTQQLNLQHARPREPDNLDSNTEPTPNTTEPVVMVSSENGTKSSIQYDQSKMVDARAPWDPISAGGRGHTTVENKCKTEIESTGCLNTLPLDICMRTRFEAMSNHSKVQEIISDSCSSILYPCQSGRKKTKECQEDRIYGNAFTDTETYHAEKILVLIDEASRMAGNGQQLEYWMTAGTMIGALAHHGRIPWDDDIDIYVRQEHMESLIRNVESLGLSFVWKGYNGIKNRSGKIFNSSLPMIPGQTHSYPFVDVFPVDCSDGILCVEFNSAEKYSAPIDSIFPLKRRPYGRLSMPFPIKARSILEDRYGIKFKEKCKKGAYNHRKERFTGRNNYHSINCSEMIFPPPFVFDQYDTDTSIETDSPADIAYVPWKDDFPTLTVEHILNDAGQRLSSVLFEDGNEVRRSYSNGLLELKRHAITYSFPDLPYSQMQLLPFLSEERLSFISNRGQRTAEELNLEVMPTLDRVVVSNNYGTSVADPGKVTDSSSDRSILRVGEWNAERGANWDVFVDFYPNADIIILNEMDWGMARSGNKDTTKEMANYLKMNYAYGVEFLELTNGNEGEINATIGQSNLIGYHGNVVMTKWPIIESRIVRLHPLYDLLYGEKTSGQAKGERRLGGRMALFTLIRTETYGDILAISMHAHSGSKNNFLKDDARLMCREIQKYSTTNVIIGGDIASPIPQTLVSECGFFPLEATNSQKGGKGSRLTPSWKVGKSHFCLTTIFAARCDWTSLC